MGYAVKWILSICLKLSLSFKYNWYFKVKFQVLLYSYYKLVVSCLISENNDRFTEPRNMTSTDRDFAKYGTAFLNSNANLNKSVQFSEFFWRRFKYPKNCLLLTLRDLTSLFQFLSHWFILVLCEVQNFIFMGGCCNQV